MEPINVFDYMKLSKEKLSKMAYDYIFSGSEDELTLKENRKAFNRIKIRQRVLNDVSEVKLETSVLGHKIPFPILTSPVAFQQLVHKEGELATAKAVKEVNSIMTLSTLSNHSIEEVASVSDGVRWFQLYFYKDRNVTRSLIERAEKNGYSAIVLTVDTPRLGRREQDIRNKFNLPPNMTVKNLEDEISVDATDSGLAMYLDQAFEKKLTWKEVDWISSTTNLPLLLKGIQTREDAIISLDYDIAGIVVSNHGGRQLDASLATIEALPEVVDAVDSKIEVLMDSGIRRGTDIFKALALGAKAVMVGRPYIAGLAVNGAEGVKHILQILKDELELTMALAGCPTIDSINQNSVQK